MSQQKFGVLGWPVTHSVSPQMQGAGFDSLGIDASYKLLPLDPGEFENGIRQLVADDFRGWNITVPHKAAMLPLLDEIDPPARLAQSVNTVLNDNGKLYGWSTDGYGLERSIREAFGGPGCWRAHSVLGHWRCRPGHSMSLCCRGRCPNHPN